VISGTDIFQWERKRAALSHDVLKNEVLPAVFKLGSVISGKVDDPGFLVSLPSTLVPKVHRMCGEAESLADITESFLSPKQWFSLTPLNQCDADTKSWLPEIVHALWVVRCDLRGRLKKLRTSVRKVRKVLAGCGLTPGTEGVQIALSDVDKLRLAIESLGSALSNLGNLVPLPALFRVRSSAMMSDS
jgi:hypothetical protein